MVHSTPELLPFSYFVIDGDGESDSINYHELRRQSALNSDRPELIVFLPKFYRPIRTGLFPHPPSRIS